ncbi:MAG TPA: hypothetical protein VGQ46_10960 [Thermoanaerobaculia bacterium]|nr:hypothetical protein [Thermoanaerobaculia bacterium]
MPDAFDESHLALGARNRRTVMRMLHHHGAQPENPTRINDAQRFRFALARREHQLDVARMKNVDARRYVALRKEHFSGRAMLPHFRRPQRRFRQHVLLHDCPCGTEDMFEIIALHSARPPGKSPTAPPE